MHPVERDDYRVPLISTYPPERAQMDTDTDTVYPAIVPVNRESQKQATVKNIPTTLIDRQTNTGHRQTN